MEIQLRMLVLEVEDLEASVAFYRRLGLDLPDPSDDRPVVAPRMGSGVTLLLTRGFAAANDPDWRRPSRGYSAMSEFVLESDAAVDAAWVDLTGAGYHGRMAPRQTGGPYVAMIDDPDGNVVLVTSDQDARPS